MTKEMAVKASNLLDAIERLEAFGVALEDLLNEYDISLKFGNKLEDLVTKEIADKSAELEAL